LKLPQLQEEWSKEERKIDENILYLELRKTSGRCKERTLETTAEEIVMLNSIEQAGGEAVPWNLQRLSMYSKIMCIVAWILKFDE